MPQPYPNGELVIVIDCGDLDRSARFWAAVLGYQAGPATSGPYLSLTPVSGVGIDVLLQRVPDVKRQKNRLHLDLRTVPVELAGGSPG
jgi:Glyoxalase-like domain